MVDAPPNCSRPTSSARPNATGLMAPVAKPITDRTEYAVPRRDAGTASASAVEYTDESAMAQRLYRAPAGTRSQSGHAHSQPKRKEPIRLRLLRISITRLRPQRSEALPPTMLPAAPSTWASPATPIPQVPPCRPAESAPAAARKLGSHAHTTNSSQQWHV